MNRYVALLRAVNVGGTGKLPMADLVGICEAAGMTGVKTYIASGNALFSSEDSASTVQQALASRLEAYAGRPVGVLIRDATEIARIVAENPFAGQDPKFVHVIFLDAAPPPDCLDDARGQSDEVLRLGRREIYVHYPTGSGRSRLRIAAAESGTARNMNTVATLAGMLSAP